MWLQAKIRDRGLGLQPRLYTTSVCDGSAAEAAAVHHLCLWRQRCWGGCCGAI